MAQKRPTAGAVVAAAEDCKTVSTGDRVVYSKFAGTEIDLNDEDFILLKEDDCIGLMGSNDVADLKPLGDRILVEVAAKAEKSAGGVILSAAEGDKPSVGRVLAAGPGRREGEEVKARGVKSGNQVLYAPYAGTEFEGKDGKCGYIVIREADVLAVLS